MHVDHSPVVTGPPRLLDTANMSTARAREAAQGLPTTTDDGEGTTGAAAREPTAGSSDVPAHPPVPGSPDPPLPPEARIHSGG